MVARPVGGGAAGGPVGVDLWAELLEKTPGAVPHCVRVSIYLGLHKIFTYFPANRAVRRPGPQQPPAARGYWGVFRGGRVILNPYVIVNKQNNRVRWLCCQSRANQSGPKFPANREINREFTRFWPQFWFLTSIYDTKAVTYRKFP